MALHAVLRWLADRGHECRVIVPNDRYAVTGVVDGVTVTAGVSQRQVAEAWEWCDVAFTHLDLTHQAVSLAVKHDRPLVHYLHNDKQLAFHKVPLDQAQLVVSNSQWIADTLPDDWPTVVVYPPVEPDRYRLASPGDAVTLVNLTEQKGAATFYELARRNPHRPFLGVRGSYGEQVIPRRLPANVTVAETTSDMVGDVYARTRVVLMPSHYESWGRVAIEACCAGIPVIAAPTPGLCESLGDAGRFAEPDDIDGWQAHLDELDDPKVYEAAAAAGHDRAVELAGLVDAQLVALEDRLSAVADTFYELPDLDTHQLDMLRRGVWAVAPGGGLTLTDRRTYDTVLHARGYRRY
jgi:glycosyltransferase involved in cell wall biosynthesis